MLARWFARLRRFVMATEEVAAESVVRPAKTVRTVRHAMLLSYVGKDFFGMQMQRGPAALPTIEQHLLQAMLKLSWINEHEYEKPIEFNFQRAARTDRAVSACRQICSLTIARDVDNAERVRQINEQLPESIRVWGIQRATKGFHAQKTCDARTYCYTLPTMALAECDQLTNASFRISKEQLERLNGVLAQFKGTHNFFNYTSQRAHSDPSSKRFIVSFEAGEPWLETDSVRGEQVEFLTLRIRGQSFMLHQIRKMVGIVLAILRGFANESEIERSFLSAARMDVPRAPGLGLYLYRTHFDRYDKWYNKTHASLNDWGPEVDEAIAKFQRERIEREIVEVECRDQPMLRWLADLPRHNFNAAPAGEEPDERSIVRDAFSTLKRAAQEDGGESGEEEDEVEEIDEAREVDERKAEKPQDDAEKGGGGEVSGEAGDHQEPETKKLKLEATAAN